MSQVETRKLVRALLVVVFLNVQIFSLLHIATDHEEHEEDHCVICLLLSQQSNISLFVPSDVFLEQQIAEHPKYFLQLPLHAFRLETIRGPPLFS